MNYLIYGNSYRLLDDEIKKIIQDKKYTSYYLSEVPVQDILEDISYNSMFDDEKIVIIREFESLFQGKKDNTDAIKSLCEYLKSPIETTTLIFLSKDKINERTKLNKELLCKLKIVNTPIITKSYELAKVFGETIKKEDYGISQNALNIFCEKCSSNYDIAYQEFNKLKEIKNGNRLITEEDIEKYVSNYNIVDSFGFKDAVVNKNIEKAKAMLDDLESSKMELVPLVVMLAKEYEMIYNVKALASKKMTNDQISEHLGGMHPYRVKLLRETSRKYTEEELKKDILYLCNLDLKLVSQDNLGYAELKKFLLEL